MDIFKSGTLCVGLYDFSSANDDDLNFKKGENLTIISATKDSNWYKGQNAEGIQGMIPANYLGKKNIPDANANMSSGTAENLSLVPWFHGKITRQVAEELLKPWKDGLFLIRESTNFPGDYTMCVCFNNGVEHYRIIFTNKTFTIDEEDYFETLTYLVLHYATNANGLVCKLSDYVNKKGETCSAVEDLYEEIHK